MTPAPAVPQTELHRHLDVSVRPQTMLALAQARGLEAQSTSLAAFKRKLFLTAPHADLTAVLARFTLFQQVLDRPEVLARVAYETVEDCWREGTRQVELRFSPPFICAHNTLTWEAVLDAFERGVARARQAYPALRVGLIVIASREYGPDVAAEVVSFYLRHRARLVAVDLAGPERAYPCRLFEEAFRPVAEARARGVQGLHVTIHAGEEDGPESVWAALERLGAERIGHGVRCVEDPQLVDYLAAHQVCLEVCPTSNWITQAVPSLAEHTLPAILAAGIPASISTDDPGIFGVTLPGEFEVCARHMGLDAAALDRCRQHAAAASFLPPEA